MQGVRNRLFPGFTPICPILPEPNGIPGYGSKVGREYGIGIPREGASAGDTEKAPPEVLVIYRLVSSLPSYARGYVSGVRRRIFPPLLRRNLQRKLLPLAHDSNVDRLAAFLRGEDAHVGVDVAYGFARDLDNSVALLESGL